MKVFLCGGGCGEQTREANKRLNEVVGHAKPCLYIPLAMEPEDYDSCYEWITGELKAVDVPSIEMVRSGEELAAKNLEDYGMIFIGGGNTFKLLRDLKVSGAYEKIKNYMDSDGVIFGGSAGAIIFGKDLEACKLEDPNDVNLQDIDGYDLLNGASILCHYEGLPAQREFLEEVSRHRKVLALPEEITLFINGGVVEVIGAGAFADRI